MNGLQCFPFKQTTKISYASEKNTGEDGPLVGSEVLFFSKDDPSTAKPLDKVSMVEIEQFLKHLKSIDQRILVSTLLYVLMDTHFKSVKLFPWEQLSLHSPLWDKTF